MNLWNEGVLPMPEYAAEVSGVPTKMFTFPFTYIQVLFHCVVPSNKFEAKHSADEANM